MHPLDAPRRTLIGLVIACGTILVVGLYAPAPGAAGDQATDGGMRMYIDPQTGTVGVPPPGALPKLQSLEQAEAPNPVELSAEPVTASAGGVKVSLHGRFQAAVQRRADAPVPGEHECVRSQGAAE